MEYFLFLAQSLGVWVLLLSAGVMLLAFAGGAELVAKLSDKQIKIALIAADTCFVVACAVAVIRFQMTGTDDFLIKLSGSFGPLLLGVAWLSYILDPTPAWRFVYRHSVDGSKLHSWAAERLDYH